MQSRQMLSFDFFRHQPDIERPLSSQGLGIPWFLGNARKGSVTASGIPTSQRIRRFLVVKIGPAI